MVEAIVSSYDAADRSRAATQATLDTRRRYEAALEAFNGRRTELMQEGVEPAAVSDQAKQEMGEQAEDLFPPGSPGDLRPTGRPRGETRRMAGAAAKSRGAPRSPVYVPTPAIGAAGAIWRRESPMAERSQSRHACWAYTSSPDRCWPSSGHARTAATSATSAATRSTALRPATMPAAVLRGRAVSC
jgi:hypothetical protein